MKKLPSHMSLKPISYAAFALLLRQFAGSYLCAIAAARKIRVDQVNLPQISVPESQRRARRNGICFSILPLPGKIFAAQINHASVYIQLAGRSKSWIAGFPDVCT